MSFSAVTYALAIKASKDYANYLFSQAGTIDIQFVDTLPTSDIKANVIYFVPTDSTKKFYNQYMYDEGKWVLVGSTELHLENYYTKDELKTELKNILPLASESTIGAIKIDGESIQMNEQGQISVVDAYVKKIISQDIITNDDIEDLFN